MSAIEDYAKRTAERLYPKSNENWYLQRSPYEAGILLLAEQLQREDVIEAGFTEMDRHGYVLALQLLGQEEDAGFVR